MLKQNWQSQWVRKKLTLSLGSYITSSSKDTLYSRMVGGLPNTVEDKVGNVQQYIPIGSPKYGWRFLWKCPTVCWNSIPDAAEITFDEPSYLSWSYVHHFWTKFILCGKTRASAELAQDLASICPIYYVPFSSKGYNKIRFLNFRNAVP